MLIGTYNAQYIGTTMCGFINKHEYCIKIDKDIYGYTVEGILNLTEETDASAACINYASENSVRRCWIIKEDVTKLGSN